MISQWIEETLGRRAAITDVGAALQQVCKLFSDRRVHGHPSLTTFVFKTLLQCLKPSAGPLLARCCHSLQPIDLARMTQVMQAFSRNVLLLICFLSMEPHLWLRVQSWVCPLTGCRSLMPQSHAIVSPFSPFTMVFEGYK